MPSLQRLLGPLSEASLINCCFSGSRRRKIGTGIVSRKRTSVARQQAGAATTRSGRRVREVLEGSGLAESYDEPELKGRERWFVVPVLAVMAEACGRTPGWLYSG